MDKVKMVALWLAGGVAGLIVLASVYALLLSAEGFADWKVQFDSAVTETLLPLFTAIVGASVVTAVGFALATALKRS